MLWIVWLLWDSVSRFSGKEPSKALERMEPGGTGTGSLYPLMRIVAYDVAAVH